MTSVQWMSSSIVAKPTTELFQYANNSRTHSEEQITQIAASIAEFGFTNPILIAPDGEIVAGHGRWLAAKQLGLPTVPVVVLSHLTPIQRQALVIADNKITEKAGWDDEKLAHELHQLSLNSFSLDLLGFDEDELEELLSTVDEVDAEDEGDEDDGDGEASEADDDEAEEVEVKTADDVIVTNPGDVWLLDQHRVLCGDALVRKNYEVLLPGRTCQMVFTDPPYNVNYGDDHSDQKIINDNLGAEFEQFLCKSLTNVMEKTTGAVYVAMSSSALDVLKAAFENAGGHWSTFIIWAKHTFTLGRSDYQRQYEPILYGWPQGAKRHWCGDRSQGDVWDIKKPRLNDLHPTMKPVELVERALRNSSEVGDVVLDPFAGSGTTLIAAEKVGRVAVVMEIDPKYVDVIVQRWQQFTGKVAKRARDQVSFDEALASARQATDVGPADVGPVDHDPAPSGDVTVAHGQ